MSNPTISRDLLGKIVDDEWVLVPKQPTAEMIKAGEAWSGLPSQTWQDMIDAAPPTTSPLPQMMGPETCVICGQTHCGICQELDDMVSSDGDRPLVPAKADVRRALEILNWANGADLDEWTGGGLPSDDIREALAAIKSSQENEDAR